MDHVKISKSNFDLTPELFDLYWEKVPIIEKTNVPLEKITSVLARKYILNVITNGITDPEKRRKARHILNRNEICELVNLISDKQYTLNNIHFHIKKLQELGMVSEVLQIQKGKKSITYFTRTAKHWIFVKSTKTIEWNTVKSDLTNLIRSRNQKTSEVELKQLFEEYDKWHLKGYDLAMKWYEEFYNEIVELELNTAPIYDFLGVLFSLNFLSADAMESLSKLSNYIFPIINEEDE